MSSQLDEPLIASEAASTDPFYAFRDELKLSVQKATIRFEEWRGLLENTNTASNRTFISEHAALKKELPTLLQNVSDLEQVVNHVTAHRSQFPHISDDELLGRKMFVKELKQEVNMMDSTLRSQRTIGKIEKDERDVLMKRARQEDTPATSKANPHGDFVQNQLQQQQEILDVQDQHLGDLENSLYRVKDLGEAIHTEIDSQNQLLDEFDNDLTSTMGRMEGMLMKMDKMLKTKSRCQTYTILALIVVVIILIFLVSI